MPKWTSRVIGGLVVLAMVLVIGGYFSILARPHPGNPLDSPIYFDDLRAFVSAHEIATANDYAAEAYANNYFLTKSPAVNAYIRQLGISEAQTAADARERPKVYDLIVKRATDIIATESDIRRAFTEFEDRYPDAVFPPVHVLYGSFRARGLIRPFGIIIGAEFFVGGDDAEDTEGWNNSSGLIVRPELLSSQLVHELAHIQQARKSPLAYLSNGNVLNWALYEGAADFVATTVTGAHTNEAAHAYLASNEEELWCVFDAARDENRRSHWIDANVFGQPPGGVAAAFGYRIVENYYKNHQNQEEALAEIVKLADYEYVYKESGIQARLASSCDQ